MQKFNLVTKGRSYTTRDGKNKVEWNQIGKATYFPPKDGKEAGLIVELNTMPGRYEMSERTGKMEWINPVIAFNQAPKEEKPAVETSGYEGNFDFQEIKEEDIPFGN